MEKIRPMAHAWTFYPANPHSLTEMLFSFYNEIDKYVDFSKYKSWKEIRWVFVPHAWYIYSWLIATAWYKVFQLAQDIDTLVMIWPAHYDAVQWWMVSSFDARQSPLGLIPVDKDLQNQIVELWGGVVTIYDKAHLPEHSLEVQIPFIQTFLKVKKIVPILAWIEPDILSMAQILDKIVTSYPNVWVLISTDLSHYLPYEEAVKIDTMTLSKFLEWITDIWPYEACGYAGLNVLIEFSKIRNYHRDVIIYANSGDTAWMKDQVVWYASWVVGIK